MPMMCCSISLIRMFLYPKFWELLIPLTSSLVIFIHRIYWTKVRLAKVKPGVDPLCGRCNHTLADLLHRFWLRPSLTSFWLLIFNCFSLVTKRQIEPCPLVALFGLSPNVTGLSGNAFSTLLARRRILLLWKQNFPPSFDDWLKDVMSFIYFFSLFSCICILVLF